MAKVLVTGGNGFLGSWLVRRLLKDGHQVKCLVRKTSDLSELEGLSPEYVYGDVTDLASVIKATENVEAVFHLAGLIAYKKSERAAMDRINVGGTKNVIEACVANKVPRLVYLSSVVAVGAGFNKGDVLTEDSVYNVRHLNLGYFETKHEAEKLVVEACKSRGLDAVILNPSTIYGPGDARKGSRKNQLKVAQGKLKFYTSGGVNVVPVENCVDGIIRAWQKGRNGERYILASQNLTIKELFRLIAEEAGTTPPSWRIPDTLLHIVGMIGDLITTLGGKGPVSRENAWTATMYHWFDSSKAQRELGFDPGSSKEALHQSVAWMKNKGLLEKQS